SSDLSQLSISEEVSSFLSPVIEATLSYRTFASTGYIMTSRPSAIGTEIPPIASRARRPDRPGTRRPSNRPATIASPIQTGNHRSRVESFLGAGGALTVA